MRYLWILLSAFFLLFVIVFASLNSNVVQLNFYLGSVHLILSFLILIVLLFGFVLSCLVFLPTWLRLKSLNRQLKRELRSMHKEASNFSLPD